MTAGAELWVLVFAGAIAAAAGTAFLGFRLLKGRIELKSDLHNVRAQLERAEAQLRDQTRQLVRMRGERAALSELFRLLPTTVRELNRSDLDSRKIPQLLAQLVEVAFEPAQILLFRRSPEGDATRGRLLQLVFHKGLTDPSLLRTTIRIGEGKIGWVAEHMVDMLAEDWLNLTRTEGRSIPDNHPALRVDLIGPLVHRHREGSEELLGVLCIGEPKHRLSDERLALQMITNLGSIAYMNVLNVSRLRDQANQDGLTRLLNKSFFMQRLGDMIIESERKASPIALFIFDIDHFKHYNDSNGHLAGDEVLRGVARVLREQLRPEDVACRYGGEEFVVAMPQTDEGAAMQVAERIREAIASTPFPRAENQPNQRLTISGGVAVFPVDANTGTELLQVADQGLYQAKGAGRNRVVRSRGVRIGEAARAEPEAIAYLPEGVADGER